MITIFAFFLVWVGLLLLGSCAEYFWNQCGPGCRDDIERAIDEALE